MPADSEVHRPFVLFARVTRAGFRVASDTDTWIPLQLGPMARMAHIGTVMGRNVNSETREAWDQGNRPIARVRRSMRGRVCRK
jgi:hypothetical protein